MKMRCLGKAAAKACIMVCSLVATQWMLTPMASATMPVPPAITSYWNSQTKTEVVIYVDVNGNLMSLSYNTAARRKRWLSQQIAGQGVYSPGSLLFAYADSFGQGRLFFLTPGPKAYFDITELRGNPPSTSNQIDLTLHTNAAENPIDFPEAGAFQAQNGFVFQNSIQTLSNLTGFQDTAATPVHHLFYLGEKTGATYEMYASDSGDNWTNHQIGPVPSFETAEIICANSGGSLTALWDGQYEHVYCDAAESLGLQETYFNGNWLHNTISTSLIPSYNVTSFSPAKDWEVVQGLFNQNGNVAAGLQLAWVFEPGSGWGPFGPYDATNYSFSSGTVGYNWVDQTSPFGRNLPGSDGGFFYVGTDANVYLLAYGPAQTFANSVNLTAGHTRSSTSVNATSTNQVTGFWDGANLHAFYVGQDGNVYELYAAGGSITNSSYGSWVLHSIGGNGQAAH
jgi:hypothetical protein